MAHCGGDLFYLFSFFKNISANAKDNPTLETKQKEIFRTIQEKACVLAS